MSNAYDNLVKLLLGYGYNTIFVEGCRLSGKSWLSKSLNKSLSYDRRFYQEYTTFRDRKALSSIDTLLDVGQATLFLMDFLRQNPTLRVICDRSTISTVVFYELSRIYHDKPWVLDTDGCVAAARYKIFRSLLPEVNGVVVYRDPPISVLTSRAVAAGREEEVSSIIEEHRIYDKELSLLEDHSLIRFTGEIS